MTRIRTGQFLLTGLLVTASAALGPWSPTAEALAQPQEESKGVFTNPRIGFKVKPPKGWNMVPLKTGEAWLACKYTSDKSYAWHDKETGRTVRHTPEFKVIAFVKSNMEDDTEIERSEDEDGNSTTTIWLKSPYKDYDEFLERTLEGGFFRDTEENEEVDGTEVDKYIYRVEKLSSAPQFVHTWIWRTEEIDYAVQFDVLQSEDKRLNKTFQRTLKSFELIERVEADLSEGSTWISRSAMNSGSPKERRTKRMESEAQLREKAIASVGKDWTVKEFGEILVLSNTDKNYTKRIADHVTTTLKHLESTFPYVGKDEYYRRPIVRILEGDEQWISFIEGSGDQSKGAFDVSAGLEIYTGKTSDGYQGSSTDYINTAIFRRWFVEKDQDMYQAMPTWLREGLEFVLDGIRVKGRKIKMRIDYDTVEAKTYIAQDKGITPIEIMKLKREVFFPQTQAESRAASVQITQAYSFVRYLISPEAKKNKYAKDFLETYMTTLKEVVGELEKKDNERYKDLDAPETEEEEDARAKALADRRRAQEQEIIDLVLERGFGDWDEKRWEKLDKAFKSWL